MKDLAAWLTWMESQHPANIELGLDRVRAVAQALDVLDLNAATVTVAGTNGKGSVVGALEALALAHDLDVAVFSSPHFFKYNERVRINGEPATDAAIASAIAAVAACAAKLSIQLTYFEYSTLAALWQFKQLQDKDLVVLEIGMGGRLDAVNICDPDLCVITSIGLDHQAWLGDSLDAIALEKAGIARPHVPMILAELGIPKVVSEHCQALNTPVLRIGDSYEVINCGDTWRYQSSHCGVDGLSTASPLKASNLAAAITAFHQLFPAQFNATKTAEALNRLQLFGRFSRIHLAPAIWLDVAHNPAACQLLADRLARQSKSGRWRAVVSVLADKDLDACLSPLRPFIDSWYFAALDHERAMPFSDLQATLGPQAKGAETIEAAFARAMADSEGQDSIFVFGSFFTVAAVYSYASKHYRLSHDRH